MAITLSNERRRLAAVDKEIKQLQGRLGKALRIRSLCQDLCRTLEGESVSSDMNCEDHILSVLNEEERGLSGVDIAKKLPMYRRSTIAATLCGMKKAGKLLHRTNEEGPNLYEVPAR